MTKNHPFRFVLLMLFTVAVLAAGAKADKLILKNGNSIEGIVTKDGNKYSVEFASGTMKIHEDEVKRVENTTSDLEKFRNRHERIDEQDADAHYQLGEWARERGLRQQAKREFHHAIQRNADHEGARKALGYTKYNGQWVTYEEKMKRKGYVKFQGEWMTPEVKENRINQKQKQEDLKKQVQTLKQKLNQSQNRVQELENRVRELQDKLRDAQYRNRTIRYYPITRRRSNPFFGRRHSGHSRPHRNLWTRKDNGNTVKVEKTRDGEIWKEITPDGKEKIIHEPGDGHTVEKNSDRSKLIRKHKPNGEADIELQHPKHHD